MTASDEYAAHRRAVGGISYVDVGEGPVTVFVHGVFTNGRLWRHCIRLLSGHRRCIAVDLPGHGHTPPTGEASVWGLADAVGTVLRELDLRDVHLVANDTGGAVTQVVLARDDDGRIASVALTNCDTEGNFPPPVFAPFVRAARLGLLRLGRVVVGRPGLARGSLRIGYQRPGSVPDDVVAGYVEPVFGSAEGIRFMERLLASMGPEQLSAIRSRLAACTIPVVLVWGTGDYFFPIRWAYWLRELIPGATDVVEVPGGRLFFVDERAPELVAALTKHWT